MDAKTRASADARFQKALRPEDGRSLYPQQETEARAAAALTAKLRAQRLEREAAEAAGPDAKEKRASAVRKAGPKKGVGSY